MDRGPQGNAGLVTEARRRYTVPRGPMGAVKDVGQVHFPKRPVPSCPPYCTTHPTFRPLPQG